MKVKVRIALAVDSDGYWNASGGSSLSEGDARSYAVHQCGDAHPSLFWLEAEVETYEVPVVEAEVVRAEETQ